jgi:heptose I phosphotransferase
MLKYFLFFFKKNNKNNCFLYDELKTKFTSNDIFQELMQLDGEVYRKIAQRKTLRFAHQRDNYFVKMHFGIGWKEILKDLFQGRLPILGARVEFRAIHYLHTLGIPTLDCVGFGTRGYNPATQQSFLITREIQHAISLEDLSADWLTSPPAFAFKMQLIKKVAAIAKTLHENGANHRDFYLGHFLWVPHTRQTHSLQGTLYLIDLHRMQIRALTPERWQQKDLGGLYFSALRIGLSQRDYFRFLCYYRQQSLRQILKNEREFWEEVTHKGAKIAQNPRG